MNNRAPNGIQNGTITHSVQNGTAHSSSKVSQESPSFPAITDIKKILPKHCFQSSLRVSLYYVLKDLSIILVLYGSILVAERYSYMQLLWTPFYWFFQGTMFWAVFVLGHDCGHGSFSRYPLLNDIIGNVLHTLIMVPYYPWKLSHKHHHKNTGNMDKDEIFYPIREKDKCHDIKVYPLFGFGLSWFMYVLKGYPPRPAKHVNPLDPMFRSHTTWCSASVASITLWSIVLWKYWASMGLWALMSHYLIPVFVFASWLVMVTFLHHNDIGLPWYSDKTWGNVKGQLSSVDRDYGWAHHLTHNIGTHQIHHLFIMIPHYHLEEANAAFKKHFPELSRICPDPILPSFVKMFKVFVAQRFVPDDAKTHVYTPLDGSEKCK